jgi:mRNA interferase RelE/StbE
VTGNFNVELTNSARKELRDIGSEVIERIATKLIELASDPFAPGTKKLQGEDDLYRARVGDYRVVYTVDTKARVVKVQAISHRSDVYR